MTLKEFTETEEQTLQWFRDHPDHEGVKMICIPGSPDLSWPRRCRRFKSTKNVLDYKVVELLFACLAEAIVLLSDGVLVSFCCEREFLLLCRLIPIPPRSIDSL